MKKEYQVPQMAFFACWTDPLLDVSGVNSPDKGIDYGGVDNDGERNPESRHSWDVWGDVDDTE